MSTSVMSYASKSRGWDPRVACAVMLVLVFLCGAGAGALVMNMGVHRALHQPDFDTPAGKIRFFERMQKELNLTPAQSEQMQSILNDFWQYYRSVLSDSKSRVEQILTDEQRRKFERMLQDNAQHQ
jgi:Spy/CpxP family protein refolding chaperone